MPGTGRWKDVVRKELQKRSDGGHKPATVLSAESSATPGCVMRGDVVVMRHGNGRVRLWQVQRSSAVEVELVRLQKRVKRPEEAEKGVE